VEDESLLRPSSCQTKLTNEWATVCVISSSIRSKKFKNPHELVWIISKVSGWILIIGSASECWVGSHLPQLFKLSWIGMKWWFSFFACGALDSMQSNYWEKTIQLLKTYSEYASTVPFRASFLPFSTNYRAHPPYSFLLSAQSNISNLVATSSKDSSRVPWFSSSFVN